MNILRWFFFLILSLKIFPLMILVYNPLSIMVNYKFFIICWHNSKKKYRFSLFLKNSSNTLTFIHKLKQSKMITKRVPQCQNKLFFRQKKNQKFHIHIARKHSHLKQLKKSHKMLPK